MNSTSCNMCFWALWSIWSIFVWIGLVFQPNLIIFGPDRDQGSPGIVRSPFGPQILLRKLKGIYLDDKICKLGRLPPSSPCTVSRNLPVNTPCLPDNVNVFIRFSIGFVTLINVNSPPVNLWNWKTEIRD